MREIKFRGYSEEYNQWLYGSYVKTQNGCFIIDESCKGSDNPNRPFEYFREVKPESVGQYAGIQLSGKDIYEGDAIDNSVARWKVIFNHGCFSAQIIGKNLRPDNDIHIALRAIKGAILIGNIHENPELLNTPQP
jgi:hypothetical protein